MTLQEIHLHLRAAKAKEERERYRLGSMLYQSACLPWMDKKPTLHEFLGLPAPKPKTQSAEEANAQLLQFFLNQGGTMAEWQEAERKMQERRPS